MDADGYPTQEELDEIENYDILKNGIDGLLDLIHSLWIFPNYYIIKGKKDRKLELHTGGWSGNESIIDALMKNTLFWPMYWEKSVRGGHYYFIIKDYKK